MLNWDDVRALTPGMKLYSTRDLRVVFVNKVVARSSDYWFISFRPDWMTQSTSMNWPMSINHTEAHEWAPNEARARMERLSDA